MRWLAHGDNSVSSWACWTHRAIGGGPLTHQREFQVAPGEIIAGLYRRAPMEAPTRVWGRQKLGPFGLGKSASASLSKGAAFGRVCCCAFG